MSWLVCQPPPPKPPPLARAAPKVNTDLAARRQAKSEYLRAYRSDQKNRAHQVGMELSQARVALEVMQDLHAELQAEHAACISRMAQGRRQSEWEPESDRTESQAKRLSSEARRLAKQLQAQKRRAELFGGMIEKLLDLGTVGVGELSHHSPIQTERCATQQSSSEPRLHRKRSPASSAWFSSA